MTGKPIDPEACNVHPEPQPDDSDLRVHLGPQIHRTDNLMLRLLNECCRQNGADDVTAMHGWILHYLYDNREREIYQKDIERRFDISRSTTTNVLQLMEKKGYIQRRCAPHDARLKKLVLTEKGTDAHLRMKKSLRETVERANSVLEPEETLELLRLLEKLQAGLKQKLPECNEESQEGRKET